MFSLPEIFSSETIEIPESVRVLDRPNEAVEGSFEYSEPYINENGFYVPRQVNGVYEDALESGEATEVIEALNVWHQQESNYSCAVVCSEMELNRQLDAGITEAELCDEGEQHGWYDPGSGTAPDNIKEYAAAHNLKTETYYKNFSLDDIRDIKENGTGIIVAVDNMLLARPELAVIKPCDVNHVVEIVGFDYSDPENPLVIINDPGTPFGQGAAYELDIFAQAAGGYDSSAPLNIVTTLDK